MNNLIILDDKFILTDEGRLFYRDTGEEYFPYKTDTYTVFQRCHKGKYKRYKLHRLVMEIFGPECPGPGYEVDHVNRDRKNASLWNLRWVTHSQNMYNTCRNRPIGKRLCDVKSLTEYQRDYQKDYQAKYRLKHREKLLAYLKEYRRTHKG